MHTVLFVLLLAPALAVAQNDAPASMNSILAAGFLMDLFYAAAALVLLWVILRAGDWAYQFGQTSDWNTVFGHYARIRNRIESEPLPAALFHAARWVGGCLLLGLLLG